MIIDIKNRFNSKISQSRNLINWYAFFMAFPVFIILGQNISLIIFIILIYKLQNYQNIFSILHPVLILPIFFSFSALISVIDVNLISDSAFSNGVAVLPNYIYWSLLIIFIVNIRKLIHLPSMTKFILSGILLLIFYYNIQSIFIGMNFLFNFISPNSFSFILICFSAPCFIYLYKIKNKQLYAIIFLVGTIFLLITDGRRAGTMLVFLPCLFALLFSKIQVKNLIVGIFTFTTIFFILQTELIEQFIFDLNPRIYELIYESGSITTEDRSYLVRRLQVEKGLLILAENPLTGIGLNNFAHYNVEFVGNFVGSEFVINKTTMNEKSAHNSYISILAEGGLLLFVPFILMILFNLKEFILRYNIRTQLENAFYWSFVAICVHLYFISGIVNVYVWFLLSIVTMLSVKYIRSQNRVT